MNQDQPKVKLQLEAVSASTKLAFKMEAAKYKSPSELFEEMWRMYIASQTTDA